MMRDLTESMRAAKTDSEARKARRRTEPKPTASKADDFEVPERSARDDVKAGAGRKRRRLRLTEISQEVLTDPALCDAVSSSEMAINSKKQKSEPADRQQSETPRQARAESKERKVTGKEEWKKPELESRGRSMQGFESEEAHKVEAEPRASNQKLSKSRKEPAENIEHSDPSAVADSELSAPESSTMQSTVEEMWQAFTQQLNKLGAITASSDSLSRLLGWLAKSFAPGTSDPDAVAKKLTAASAFLDLGAALLLDDDSIGMDSSANAAFDFVKASFLGRAILDNVITLDLRNTSRSASATLEHVPPKQQISSIMNLMNYASDSGSTVLGKELAQDILSCCTLALSEETASKQKAAEQLSTASQITCAAAVAADAACSITAEEVLMEQAKRLALLEARCRVRTACSQAACAAVVNLRKEIGQESGQDRGAAEVFQAAEAEAEHQSKALQVLWEELEKGRSILSTWSAIARPMRRSEQDGTVPSLSMADWVRLEDGQHINDSLLDFFVNRLVQVLGGWRVHAFSSHFFAMLAGQHDDMDSLDASEHGWSRVRTWTRGVRRRHPAGIFDCDYLFLPLHHEAERHWSLAVVCRPWAAVNIGQDVHTTTTVAFLDSLRSSSSETREAVVLRKLKSYLRSEWQDCTPLSASFDEGRIQAVAIDVPQQQNSSDCGIYVLEFVLQLLCHPGKLASLGRDPLTLELQVGKAPRQRWRQAGASYRSLKQAAAGGSASSFDKESWMDMLLVR